ncbi:amidase [Humidisolicoccus flavus]|uniref:amidase n=1 Tax=Humidisolicoccus flavus TaxID=3111414 RepID=UPI00325469E0
MHSQIEVSSPLHEYSALEQWQLIRSRAVSVRELTEHYLRRSEAHGDETGAFARLTPELALERADALDSSTDRTGLVFGLPFADKDLTARAGVRSTFGSRAFAEYVPEASDPLAATLDAAGGVSIGRTRSPEFGLHGYTDSLLYGPTSIPGFPELGAGGSSGGAAAAVAAGLLPFAPGSDGGGSIRIPAGCCGLVGLKPSRGRVPSGSGVGSLAGLPVAGPLARTVADAALLLDAMIARTNGVTQHRFTLRAPEHDDGSLLAPAIRGEGRYRIGMTLDSPWKLQFDISDSEAALTALAVAERTLGEVGHEVVDFSLPENPEFGDAFKTVWQVGAAGIAQSPEQLALLEPLTQHMTALGKERTALDLARSLSALAGFEQQVIAAFGGLDAILTPIHALTPRAHDWWNVEDALVNFEQQCTYLPYTSWVNVAGLPAIALPVFETEEGVPMGVQLIGKPGTEAVLLSIAAQLERRIPWRLRGLKRFAGE